MNGDSGRSRGNPPKIGVPRAADQSREWPESNPGGRFDIRIDPDGTWYYRGTPILRKPLVKLFSTVLRRDESGDYWLVTPVERGRIEVEDAPFAAVELSRSGDGRDQVLSLRTNVDDWVELGPDHPIRVVEDPESGTPRPYILVRDRLEALIVRSLFYELVDLAVEREEVGGRALGLWSKGAFFPLWVPTNNAAGGGA